MSQKLRVFDRINRIYWIIESMPEAWTQKNQSRYARDWPYWDRQAPAWLFQSLFMPDLSL
jgi:hypothetical protein